MKRILFLCLIALPILVFGQKKLTLDDVIAGGKSFYNFYPRRMNVDFKPGTSELIIVKNDTVFTQKAWRAEEKELFNLTDLNTLLEAKGVKALQRLPWLNWMEQGQLWFQAGIHFVVMDVTNMKIASVSQMAEEGEVPDFCLSNNQVAYAKGNDLIIGGAKQEVVAASEGDGMVYGRTVHRNEFGIEKGTYWSPKGNFLAFYRKDESMVTDYPLVNIEKRSAEVENIKYPMAGMASHEVTVGIYNMKTKKVAYLKTGEPKARFFTNLSWTPDEKYLLVAELNREQNHMKLNKYDIATGELVKTLFEEKDDHWVEPQHPALFIPGKGDRFIWQTPKDGFNNLYVYDLEGNLKKQLTKGNRDVTSVLGFDAKARNLFIECASEDALERHAYRVSLESGKMTQITRESGSHAVKISSDGKLALDSWSALDVPSKTQLLAVGSTKSRELQVVTNPYEGYDVGQIKLVTIKSADNTTDLNGRIVLPPNFDPAKKYPVIVYVYGGPHAQLVQNRWLGGARGWQLYMAQQGYIAFTMDNRGTPYRGKDFEQAIHRHLGNPEVDDQMKGVAYLKSLPYVDTDRIGVHGWSYGGFMTISLMLKQSDVFKVGVAGGPVIDWKYYEIMYGERYMDMPDENPEGYKSADLKQYVKNLKGRLLVIHGGIDPVVVWQHSLSFVRECVKEGVQLDYFVYPRHEHNVLGPNRVHLMQKVTRYFEDFL